MLREKIANVFKGIMKKIYLFSILLFFCLAFPIMIYPEEQQPLLLGGKPYEGYLTEYAPDYSAPKKILLKDAGLVQFVTLDIDPLNPEKRYSLENIELLSNLKRLTVSGTNLNLVDFTPISLLYNLERLYIDGNIERLPDLKMLTRLSSVIIENSKLTTLEGLAAPALRRLDIHLETFDSLVPLSNAAALERLDITTNKNNEFVSIGNIENVPSLKRLDLWTNGTFDLTGIENITSLNSLFLRSSETYLVNPQGISKLINLSGLLIKGKQENYSIEYLRNLHNLEFLDIWHPAGEKHITSDQILDVTPLENNKKLRIIDFRGFVIRNISALDNLPNLLHNVIFLDSSRLENQNDTSIHELGFSSAMYHDS